MAQPTPKHLRKFTSPYLSDRLGGKIIVACDICGKHRQYDAQAVLDRLDEDMAMPDLVRRIAIAEGCDRQLNPNFGRPCGIHFDLAAMEASARGGLA